MTNNYDAPHDLDAQQIPQHQYGNQLHGEAAYRGSLRAPATVAEAAEIRSRLATNLRASVEEARNLTTFYDNFAQTLELCLSQLETKK